MSNFRFDGRIYHEPYDENHSTRIIHVSLLSKVGTIYSAVYKNEPPHDKINKMSVRPAKTRISLGIRPVWSESSLCTQWVAKDPSFIQGDSKDSD